MDEVQLVTISSLLPAISPRLRGEDTEHTRALAEAENLPPIVVHRQTMRIIDGTHRVSASRLRGESMIKARFFDGSDQDAFALAVRTNIAYGLPLSYADRVAAAAEIIRQNPHWSDRSVAATAGLSAGTVAGIRQRALTPEKAVESRTGRDGRVRPVDPEAGRQRAREILAKSPEASLRQVARAAGISPSTARDVRARMQGADGSASNVQQLRRQSRRHPAVHENAGADRTRFDAESVLENLTRDPSLRFTESGRAALRWLAAHVIRREEWRGIITELPPHTLYLLIDMAQECADEWARLAHCLKEQTQRAS